MAFRRSLLPISIIAFLISMSSNADEDTSARKNVLEQTPYPVSTATQNTVVIHTERHGKGTFRIYRPYGAYHSPHRLHRKARSPHYRQHPSPGIYTTPQPTVSYYYSTPAANSGQIIVESNYRAPVTPYQPGHSGYRTGNHSYQVQPGHRPAFFQQYRSYPYHGYGYQNHHRQYTAPQPLPQCLGPDCGTR